MAAAVTRTTNATNGTSRTIPSRIVQRRMSCRAFQPLQRLDDLAAAAFRLLALLALAIDHLFGRAPHEVGIAELGVDPLDVGVDLAELLLEPRLLGCDV